MIPDPGNIDYKKAGVVESHLPDWSQRAGWQTLLNTRGLMWKKLSEAERADVDAAKALTLMCTYPVLVKRPVLDVDPRERPPSPRPWRSAFDANRMPRWRPRLSVGSFCSSWKKRARTWPPRSKP